MSKSLLPYVLKKRSLTKNITLLGYWCCAYDNRFQKNKLKILKHPWDNFNKLKEDYVLIESYYKIYLEKLLNILNQEHNNIYSRKFWEILIGPWLFAFITIFYEKWLLIDKIKNERYIIECYNHLDNNPIVKNHLGFKRKTLDDEWHYNLFLRILKKRNLKKIFFKNVNYKNKKKQENIKDKLILREVIIFLIIKFFGFFKKRQNVVIFDTYLGPLKNLILSIKNFNFIPQFYNIKYDTNKYNFKKRSFLFKKNNNFSSSFQKFLMEEILVNLPLDFLENFNNVKKIVNNSNLPLNPKVIFTTNGIYFDSIKTRYIAECVETGSKLILAQHGGVYGHLNFNFLEDFEIRVSDCYLSWGWKKNNFKVKKIGIIKNCSSILRKKNKNFINNTRCLFIVQDLRRHINNLTSLTCSKDFYEYYFKFCPEFISSLKINIQNHLTARFLSNISQWNAHTFFKKKFSNIKITLGQEETYPDAINNARLVICTYLSTSFLECMMSNVPTILVLRSDKNVFNLTTQKILSKLKKNNIYFDNYLNAAKFINENWDCIDNWWETKNIQNARKAFVKNFCKENHYIVNSIQTLIDKYKKIVSTNNLNDIKK
jgi:putative transferase (TIGR04331 family)